MRNAVTISGSPSERLEEVLESWLGTPRMAGQRSKGVGTDCAGFVAGVLEELSGSTLSDVPLDVEFQIRTTAEKAFKAFRKTFAVHPIQGTTIQPGDILLVGRSSGGLAHAFIAGNICLYQCGNTGVSKAGLRLQNRWVLKKILRLDDKGGW